MISGKTSDVGLIAPEGLWFRGFGPRDLGLRLGGFGVLTCLRAFKHLLGRGVKVLDFRV